MIITVKYMMDNEMMKRITALLCKEEVLRRSSITVERLNENIVS